MKKSMCFFVALSVFFAFIGITEAGAEKIIAFCGSASKPATEEAASVFQGKTGIAVELHFSGSGTMLSQMKLSRRGDVYMPGSPDYMARAVRDGVIDPSTVKIIAYLVPAINVQKGNPKNIRTLADLARPGVRVGIGNPKAVCVGLYAVEILKRNGLLPEVRENIVTHAPSCSSTAALLVMKKVDAVIGWRVFSEWKPDKIEAVFLKEDEVPRLAYIPAAVSHYSRKKEKAGRFIDFLTSSEGQKIYARWGYIVQEGEARKYAPKAKIGGEYRLPADYNPGGMK